MTKRLRSALLLFCLTVAAVQAAYDSINKDLVVTNCERSMDISSQLVKMNHKVSFQNNGQGAVKSVLFSMDPTLQDKVSFIEATVGSSDKTYLRVTETKVQSDMEKVFWKIDLKSALTAGSSVTLQVDVVLGRALEMYPAQITQKEKQLARFTGNLYAFLPYPVTTQSTTVSLASSNVESYTKTKPVSLSETTLSYGPFNNIAAFTVADMTVHAENNNPMLVVTRLERLLELSMWGNIAVEETVDVAHRGALLKGSFSRYEFQRESSGVSSVKNFKTLLPASSKDVYYRDDIGNISTSHMRVMDDAVELDLRPRFPLFGGWKTHYVVGYNVPSYEYLFYSGNKHVLNMRLVDHIFDDMLVEEAEVKVILPEGVTDIEVKTPYTMTRGEDGLHHTYLDTTGRTVIHLSTNKLLTENHIQDFQISFSYPHRTMVTEPLLLVSFFFFFYLVTIIYVRLDFSITQDEGAEAKMKVAGYCEKVAAIQDKRSVLYHSFEEALLKLKANKDSHGFQSAIKKIAAEHKAETAAMGELQGTLKALSSELGDKVADIQKQDKTVKDLQTSQGALVERLVGGKIAKQAFIDQEGNMIRKKQEALEKIMNIIKSF